MNVLSATDPQWANAEQSMLLLTVQFEHLAEPVAFAASPDDVEAHGRWLFAMARDGSFGEVAPFAPPTPQQLAVQENPAKRQSELTRATNQARHWAMMDQPEQAAAWRSYYQQLYALEDLPSWPFVEQWPEAPLPY